eukprot:CAMPEP_0113585644 /NCGR_PEP_ID=MMETSP0015_2-20120614/33823_1 /TAXON_ID=2838 /ORGANISM="Odontella" /LENGTH=66 /DNA_ID=CAMNT_0000490927 /DNA_START=36 /DNA_END=236 /DNA_ORIENTATION=+ /assembly_acc=CAM_ASM_000160
MLMASRAAARLNGASVRQMVGNLPVVATLHRRHNPMIWSVHLVYGVAPEPDGACGRGAAAWAVLSA